MSKGLVVNERTRVSFYREEHKNSNTHCFIPTTASRTYVSESVLKLVLNMQML